MKALGKITGRFFGGAAVLAVAVSLSFSGCSKDPSGGGVTGGDPDRPGRSGQLKVQTSVLTRSAVDGTVLPAGSAIGVVVTTVDGSAYFTPSATSGSGSADGGYYPDGRNVRFCNETGVNTWTSTTAGGKTRLLLFSGGERGKIYGYYPWTDDADIEGEGSSATVPVGILREGTIVVDAATDKPAYTAQGETDYMYSSRSDEVGTATTTTARLVMEHALSRVSFRMYASSAAQAAVEGDEGSYYEFTGYTLRNRNGSEDLHARFDGDTRMKVSTGEIAGALSGGEYVRRIEGYRLERSKGDTPEEDNTAANGSLRVGHLCFPLASIGHDGGKTTGLEAVFEVRRMRGDGTVASAPAAYALPLAVVPDESDKWLSGKHYTYTVKFTGSSLSVESVTVTRWNEAGGDMNIGEDPYVSSAAVAPDGDIPVGGDTYSVTLEGILPLAGVEVRACIDELPGSILGKPEPLATGTVTASGTAVELTIPANTGVERTVVFEYKLNGAWTKIAERTWKSRIGELYGGGVIYWVDPEDASDFRVVALNEPPSKLAWAASTSYVLGDGAQSETERNGADVWKLALASSEGRLSGESGVFADDYPAFEYCYNKTDGGVAKGTWYLPSLQELMDLYNAKRNIQSVIAAGGGTAFSAGSYRSATEYGTGKSNAWDCEFGFGFKSGISKTSALKLRCVRGKGEVEPYVSSAAVSPASGDIPGGGGAYGITLKGLLPSDGVEVRANISGADPVTGKATAPGTPVELNIPANTTGAERTVVFEYKWNGTWTKIVECSQVKLPSVGELYGGGVVYWADPADASDFRVVALDQAPHYLQWAASEYYVLGSGAQDETARNGADVWKIAKSYSDNKTNGASGTFATDFPAFSYCYEMTDGGVSKGTWYLPSIQELKDLDNAKGSVESIITDNKGTAFTAHYHRSATEHNSTHGNVWIQYLGTGKTANSGKWLQFPVRCVRSR